MEGVIATVLTKQNVLVTVFNYILAYFLFRYSKYVVVVDKNMTKYIFEKLTKEQSVSKLQVNKEIKHEFCDKVKNNIWNYMEN